MAKKNLQQQPGCPAGCCDGTEILCVSIPCPVTVVLLGLQLQLELPCIRLTSPGSLTAEQLQQLLAILTGIIGGLGSSLPTDGTSA
ncbi:hypothetical protein D4T97_017305 [Siminovitchia acidinfaciens]|uniref:Uncharacterized protein n=1 Tax=Siminovitchia acidinfaciens TaxID=2321395 RepID=A0A429XV22_9BACI|nr:hypothetical protein [Siminovitchia acidinfaciens]RST72018.1 hypothetical protein D4T97_017305 [Siminovitchia acidinfaciens]